MVKGSPGVALTQADDAYVRQWLADYSLRVAHNFTRYSAPLYLAAAIITPMITPPPFSWYTTIALGLLTAVCNASGLST